MLYNQNWDKDSIPAILNRAADILDTRGHTKGFLLSESGFCAVGAIMSALGGSDEDIATMGWTTMDRIGLRDRAKEVAMVVCRTVVCAEMPQIMHSASTMAPLIYWNNTPERTGEEVSAKFREVAATYVTA